MTPGTRVLGTTVHGVTLILTLCLFMYCVCRCVITGAHQLISTVGPDTQRLIGITIGDETGMTVAATGIDGIAAMCPNLCRYRLTNVVTQVTVTQTLIVNGICNTAITDMNRAILL